MTIHVRRTPYNQDDLIYLQRTVQASRYIALLTLRELTDWVAAEHIIFIYKTKHIQAFAAWNIIDASWCELGPYWVLPTARGRGHGRELLRATAKATAHYHHFAITKNPAMAHLLTQFHFERVAYRHLPVNVRRALRNKFTPQRTWHLLRKFSFERPHYFIRETQR